MKPSAAILTLGSELVEGLRVDTNTAEIARSVVAHGFTVAEAISVGDDRVLAATALKRLTAAYALVIVTGGLGPTHDDVTRDAASDALSLPLATDASIAAGLAAAVARHTDPDAAAQVLSQALVLEGAAVIPATTGTAPGQVVSTPAGILALLPGPPSEMRPMLATVMSRYRASRAQTRTLGVVGRGESDVQLAAQRVLEGYPGVVLTVLARPGDVQVILLDEGAGESVLAESAERIAAELGASCYSTRGETLPQATVAAAVAHDCTIATAESCTGGMVAAALTTVSGSSDAFVGGVVSYADAAKRTLLGVDPSTLAEHGAVSEEVALAMATGARHALGADLAVAVTGVAGPSGGSAEKPVGLVWFALADADGVTATSRRFPSTSSRDAIRERSTALALDLLRTAALSR